MAKNSNYIFSTLANDQKYQNWIRGEGVNTPGEFVYITGGAGVANDRIVTPLGVMTEVSDEQLAVLKSNVVFQKHERDGFIVVQNKKADPEKVASDMNRKDPGAPITPSHYEGAEDQPHVIDALTT